MRHAFAVILSFVIVGAIYSLTWLHENPIAEEEGWKNVTFDERVIEINASALPTGLGEWGPIGRLRTVCVSGDVRACIGLDFSGKRDVGGD